MRKTMLTSSLVLFGVAFVLALAACTQDCENLDHDWSDWIEITAATCTKSGKKVRVCSRCDAKDTDTIDALGHAWGEPSVVESTCTEKGKKTYECSICHVQESVDIDEADHEYGVLHAAVTPTCVDDGNVAYFQCLKCQQYFDSNKVPIQNITIPATGEHNWQAGAVTQQPTCTEHGTQIYECAVCHQRDSRDLDEIGHDYGELHEAVAPTCVAVGNMAYFQCSRCMHYFDNEKCPLENVTLPATGVHAWDVSESNVTWIWPNSYEEFLEVGVKAQLKCTVCAETEQRAAIAVKDEEHSQDATCTQEGRYIFTAKLTVGETTLVDVVGRTYTLPVLPSLPDGKPDQDFALVGDLGSIGEDDPLLMTWKSDEQVYEIRHTFSVSQTWAIEAIGSVLQYGGNDIASVMYKGGLTQPSTDLFTVLTDGADEGKIKMNYDCTLLITLDLTAGKIRLFVEDVDLDSRELECWFVGGLNGWSTDDPAYKFERQQDGTYTLTVSIESTANEGATFKIVCDGVELGYDDVNRVFNRGQSTAFGKGANGTIRTTHACTLKLTYDPATNTLTLDVLEE